jgi:hypothetical protein
VASNRRLVAGGLLALLLIAFAASVRSGRNTPQPSDGVAVAGAAGAPNTASVSGRVFLEGRTRHNGVYATLDRGDSGFDETGPDGVFVIGNITLGWHILRLDMPRYLAIEGRFLAGQDTTILGDLVMLGGDAFGDNIIDILDLALVGRQYGTEPPGDPRADINDNGAVDIFDLVLVAKNYDREGPTDGQNAKVDVLPRTLSAVARERPIVALKAPDPSDPRATWTLAPDRPEYKVGDVVTATLRLSNAGPVFGLHVRADYDEKQLRPRDADRSTPAVDANLGTLFAWFAFAPINRVEKGALRIDVAQVGERQRPTEGTAVEAIFEIVGCGETILDPRTSLRLTDGRASVIPFNAAPAARIRTPCP